MVVRSTRETDNGSVGDPKRARILEGATQVFLAYGFARTTMDDIARAAEISRPALYLIFRNKADIFRAVGESFLERSCAGACEALQTKAPLGERLIAALDRALFELFRTIEASPHGDELVDMKHQISTDVVCAWRDRLVRGVSQAIADEAARRGTRLEARGLSAEALAEMLFDMIEGLKARGMCGTAGEPCVRQFVQLIEAAMEAPTGVDASA